MPLIQVKRYIHTISKAEIRIVECIYIERDNGEHIATVSVLKHDLEPKEFAEYLQMASEWFVDVSLGRVDPMPVRKRNRGTVSPPIVTRLHLDSENYVR